MNSAPETQLKRRKLSNLASLLPQLTIVLLCAFCARSLIPLYLNDRGVQDPFPEYFFLLWISPICYWWYHQLSRGRPLNTTPWLSGLGLVVAVIGSVAKINSVTQVGLMFALAGLLPSSAALSPWLLGAISWGSYPRWFIALQLGPIYVSPLRALFLGVSLWFLYKHLFGISDEE